MTKITPERQIQRALRHAAEHFQQIAEPVLTDIIVRVFPHSGEVKFYDDDERELMRIVIEEWIHGSRDEYFYTKVTPILRKAISDLRAEVIDEFIGCYPQHREGYLSRAAHHLKPSFCIFSQS